MSCPRCGSANDPDTVICRACGALLLRVGALPDGFLIASRYEIVRRIGAGGMGMVYEAFDRVLEEDVAIKVLRPEIADHPDMARRFRQEIKLARRVRHRNVCGIHEYGEMGDLHYIAMEYVRGLNLRRVLREEGALAPAEAFAVCAQVARGLQAIHDAGVIHRDLKTSNIMRDEQGIVRVMDFGIAKQQGSEVTLAGLGTGLIVGTPEYMSPEQARAEPVDFRSDIYSLGVVIYEIFTGTVPFRGDTPVATMLKHLSEPPPLSGAGVPPLPETLVPVLAKALAKTPEDRYGEARELLSAIRAAGGGAATGAPATREPTGPVDPTSLPLTEPMAPNAPTALPASVVTEVDRPSTPTPVDVPGPGVPPPVRGRLHWPRWLLPAGLVVLLALVGATVLWTKRGERAPASPTPAGPPPHGTVVVDALPWGEVERIVDASGRAWPVGANRYTPFVASLPPGDYVIALRHPDAAGTASVRVTIRPAQLERRVVALREIDVDQYLHQAGF